jgi:hypothetical protein
LVKEQFGFRTNLSTNSATYRLFDPILTALNEGSNVDGIFCDLEKACDCVNHKFLLFKLEFYGISGSMLKLIVYLKGRFQRARIQSTCSDWGNIFHGVPQSSVLGSLLFLIYINDLPVVLNKISTPILLADDTSVIISVSDPSTFCNMLNKVFKTLNIWFNANLLALNFTKTEYIIFTAKKSYEQDNCIKIAYGNKEIPDSCHIKFLGINITNTLSWKKYIDQLVPKLNTACYAIRIVKPYVNLETLLMVYYAYFHSIMHYSIMFWGNLSYAINVFRVQKRALRIMMGISSRDSCRQLFITLGTVPLQSQYIYSLLCFMINNMDSYQFILDVHNRNKTGP